MPKLSIRGFDYSFSRPDPAALKRAGAHYVVRYGSRDARKNLSVKERDDLWQEGLAIALVFEDTAGRALQGRKAGREDAKVAAELRHKWGMRSAPWYFAVDRDTGPHDWPAVGAYFEGCEQELGHDNVGAYCEYDLVGYLLSHGLCSLYWQTAAWSRLLCHPAAVMYQRRNGLSVGGGSVDLDVAATDGWFGALGPHGKPFHGHHAHPHRHSRPDRRKLAEWRRRERETYALLREATLPSVLRSELQAYAHSLRAVIRKELGR